MPISTQIILSIPFKSGKYNLSVIDQGWVESFRAQGLFISLEIIFKKYQHIQYSIITSHLTLVFLFFGLIIIF